MPQQSPTLSLPYIQPAQAQKHVTHNEALRILDAVTQLTVIDATLAEPPVAAQPGERYIVGPAATGDWAGQEAAVTVLADGAWTFYAPSTGWRADVAGTGETLRFDGTDWQPHGLADLQNQPFVGVNSTADASNRLTVSSDAVLLNHQGAGHQLKINKATTADTASLLFQTGFSGRAEMGTAGTDGFSIKYSSDGNAFTKAFEIDPNTGYVTIGPGVGAEDMTITGANRPVIQVCNTGGPGGAAFRMTDNNSGGDWQFKVTGVGDFRIRDEVAALDVVKIRDVSPHTSTFAGPVQLPAFTVATLPHAASSGAGSQVYVSDESGGAVLAFSDGSNWRRVTDRAVVS